MVNCLVSVGCNSIVLFIYSFIEDLEIKINEFKIIESPNMNSTPFTKVKGTNQYEHL